MAARQAQLAIRLGPTWVRPGVSELSGSAGRLSCHNSPAGKYDGAVPSTCNTVPLLCRRAVRKNTWQNKPTEVTPPQTSLRRGQTSLPTPQPPPSRRCPRPRNTDISAARGPGPPSLLENACARHRPTGREPDRSRTGAGRRAGAGPAGWEKQQGLGGANQAPDHLIPTTSRAGRAGEGGRP